MWFFWGSMSLLRIKKTMLETRGKTSLPLESTLRSAKLPLTQKATVFGNVAGVHKKGPDSFTSGPFIDLSHTSFANIADKLRPRRSVFYAVSRRLVRVAYPIITR